MSTVASVTNGIGESNTASVSTGNMSGATGPMWAWVWMAFTSGTPDDALSIPGWTLVPPANAGGNSVLYGGRRRMAGFMLATATSGIITASYTGSAPGTVGDMGIWVGHVLNPAASSVFPAAWEDAVGASGASSPALTIPGTAAAEDCTLVGGGCENDESITPKSGWDVRHNIANSTSPGIRRKFVMQDEQADQSPSFSWTNSGASVIGGLLVKGLAAGGDTHERTIQSTIATGT